MPARPRPLSGEPLCLDLLNTTWIAADGPYDLLATDEGLGDWLRDIGFPAVPTPAVRANLSEARTAIRAYLDSPGTRSEKLLNNVLTHGVVRVALRDGAPFSEAQTERGWEVAFAAARNVLELVEAHPDRIHRCANPACVLYFYDTSRPGSRRWCSMSGCGNRSKVQRHRGKS